MPGKTENRIKIDLKTFRLVIVKRNSKKKKKYIV